MVKLVIFMVGIALCVTVAVAADCPSSSKVQNCTPKCVQDSECSKVGGKCCPNVCNARSCAQPNVLSSSSSGSSAFGGGNDKYSGGSGGSGVYCGNVKCSSFEKCNMDRSTNRPKCVRA